MRVAQKAVERAMPGIKLTDHVANSRGQDIEIRITSLKWSKPGHIARRGGDRKSKVLTEWLSRNGYKIVGRPAARWDDIIKVAVDG